MTNNIIRRTADHSKHSPGTHTTHYQIHRLVYFQYFRYVRSAISRETALKHTTKEQKIAPIEKSNPTWSNLYPDLLAMHLQNGGEPNPLNQPK